MSQQTDKSVARRSTLPTPAATPAQPVMPPEVRELLGPAPLTSTEDHAAYERMLGQLALAISPSDFIEWTAVKELADLSWEAARARRAIAVRLALARKPAIHKVLETDRLGRGLAWTVDQDELWEDAAAIADGEADAEAEFQATLAKLGLSERALDDAAYLTAVDEVQKLQDLAEKASARRDAILRQLERRRDAAAERARKAAAIVPPAIDAEFE